ncbi:MAG TPA: thioredoxin family protein [Kofleriaceae bacterium]|jgi:thioredoxin-like negative regulator of GroEL
MLRMIVLAGVVLAGCKGHRNESPPPAPAAGSAAPIAATCPTGEREGSLAWIRDDYAGALACAKSKQVPLVLDLWAPWCHTCLSMQTTVLIDPSFAADADKFVFASLDTDKDVNAPALTKLAISAWPTFYVVGGDETVMARFVGAASLAQFHGFLDAGAKAVAGGAPAADAHLLGAERALAIKDLATADTELTAAIAAAPADWPRKPDVLGSLILTKSKRGDLAGCLDLAQTSMNATGNAAVASDFLVTAMDCADTAEKAKKLDAKLIAQVRGQAAARWQTLLADKTAQLSVDDRSDAMASLRDTLDKLGKPADAKAMAEQQAKLLDDAAAKAPTPLAAMTYNWPRAEVYVYLGRPLDLVPALEKSAADLPKEYDPPARLGWLYWKAQKYADAATWTDKALALAYGPRKARLLGLRADIAKAAGDPASEKDFRGKAVAQYESLPKGEEMPDALAAAKAALAAASGAGSAG